MIFFFIRRTTNSYLQTVFFYLTFTNALYFAFTAKIIIIIIVVIVIIIITPIDILQLIHWTLLSALFQNFDFISQPYLNFGNFYNSAVKIISN